MNSEFPSAYSNADQVSPSAVSAPREEDRGEVQLTEGEVMRIEVYEEIPKFDRAVVVREQVQIKKILMQESAEPQP
ncbi:MAG: DUF2382 domain-containing protein [Leptolyngbyaceae cyanobacterium bins.302]|nr:DUF2382 domain-containing protein [Leptolyngbyaceae cyanobacterium bins.302]